MSVCFTVGFFIPSVVRPKQNSFMSFFEVLDIFVEHGSAALHKVPIIGLSVMKTALQFQYDFFFGVPCRTPMRTYCQIDLATIILALLEF